MRTVTVPLEILIPSLLGLIGVTVGAVWTYRGNVKAKMLEATSSPYGEMSKHVVELSKDVSALREQVSTLTAKVWALEAESHSDRDYLVRVVETHPGPLPQPVPSWLASRFRTGPLSHPPSSTTEES